MTNKNKEALEACPRCHSTNLLYVTWWTTMSYAEVSCDECDFSVTAGCQKTADEDVKKIWNGITDWKFFKRNEYIEDYESFQKTADSYLQKAIKLGYEPTALQPKPSVDVLSRIGKRMDRIILLQEKHCETKGHAYSVKKMINNEKHSQGYLNQGWRDENALFLYGLLDDIDTVSDMVKGNDGEYRRIVEKIQHRRFEMTDMIKQIEEALDRLQTTWYTGDMSEDWSHFGDIETIRNALSVLQKIASGDDWFNAQDMPFNIECLAVRKNKTYKLVTRNDKEPNFASGVILEHALSDNPQKETYNYVTKWKHIDQAKHIKMLLEREMNDE